MKLNFIAKLNTRLFVVPVLLILLAYLGIGIWFYFSGATYVLKDFHSAQLLTMLSDKKNSVELWIDIKKRSLEELTKNSMLSNDLRKIIGGDASAEAGQRISKYIEDYGQFRSVSFLSPTGTVIWSTKTELTGREWPDKDIFTKGLGRADVISGRVTPVANAEGILFSITFTISGDQQILIVAQPNPVDLAASLKVEKGFYQSGKVSIIDGSGRVVASKDATDIGHIRYNIRPEGLEGADYRDGLFYSVSPLRNEQLRLIATLDAAEAAKPLGPLKAVYFAFAGLIIVAVLLQGIFIEPMLIGRPVSRLVKATQSIAEGDLRAVNLRKGYAGELRNLAEAFAEMVVVLNKRSTAQVGLIREPVTCIQKTPSVDIFSVEALKSLMELLGGISRRMEKAVSDSETAALAVEVKGLVMSLDDINAIMNLKGGTSKLSKSELPVCDVLNDAEESCRFLVSEKEIELIADCPEPAASAKAVYDAGLVKRLCSAILRNAIKLTEVGTVTLLFSAINRNGLDNMEFSVSDTGIGIDAESIRKIVNDGCYIPQYLDLCIGRELATILGGEISMESSAGKGSLVLATIPAGGKPAESGSPEGVS